MADDRDTFHDTFGAGRSDDADRWPANESGPAGDVAAPKTGKSGVVKVLLILLAVGVVAGVLCCGAGFWWVSSMKPTTEPAKVKAQTAEIVDITIPDTFRPAVAMNMNMFVMTMQITMYEKQPGMLMVAQVQAPQGADQAQMEQQLRTSMQQQNMGVQLTVKESQSRTIKTAGGNEVDFLFATATNTQDNSEWRQVTGAFPGKNGTAFLSLQQPADQFDEEAVVKMLESIKTK